MRLFLEFKGKQTRMSYDPKSKTFNALTVPEVDLSNSAKNKRAPRKSDRSKVNGTAPPVAPSNFCCLAFSTA
jgi:hypothetical protein